ncbi:hypothetical protein [[Pseudomonas] boreopolis]|uniref:hypothetical protein n=1 Tax=Xanthomonas boreopolis TaxID=86183 RepID=UPI003D9B4467
MTSHSAAVKRFFWLLFFTRHIPVPRPSGGFAVRRCSCSARAQAKKSDSPQGESHCFLKKSKAKATSLDPRLRGDDDREMA